MDGKLAKSPLVQKYVDTLLLGEEGASNALVREVRRKGWTVLQIYCDLFTPACYAIGRLWCAGEITPAHEHLATQMILREMENLRASFSQGERSSLSVMVGVFEGDRHFVGAMMVADVFRMDRWNVDFLGSDVPVNDLLEICSERGPDLVALSVTMPFEARRLADLCVRLKGSSRRPAVMLGGSAVRRHAKKWERQLGVKVVLDLTRASQLGRELVSQTASSSSLESFLEGLGRRVRMQRLRQGLTQRELAVRSGLDRTYIVGVEQGKQNLTIGTIMKIAEALSLPMDSLLSSAPKLI